MGKVAADALLVAIREYAFSAIALKIPEAIYFKFQLAAVLSVASTITAITFCAARLHTVPIDQIGIACNSWRPDAIIFIFTLQESMADQVDEHAVLITDLLIRAPVPIAGNDIVLRYILVRQVATECDLAIGSHQQGFDEQL